MFLRISIVLTILAVFGASISGVLNQKARQEKIQKALKQITSQDQDEQKSAVDTLIELKAKEAIPNITILLQNNNSDVRWSAVYALAKLGAKETIPTITKLLQDNASKVRWSAVYALSQLGTTEVIPQITKLLQDNEINVRRAAVYALAKLGYREAIPELIKLLDDNDEDVRGITAIVLVEIGFKDKVPMKAIEDIKRLLEYPNTDVSTRARDALKALGVPNSKIEKAEKENPEAEKFCAIESFYRKEWPNTTFEYPPFRFVDGPSGNLRYHIHVPKEMESFYLYPYSESFLKKQFESVDPLVKIIADDLLQLRRGILFTRPGSTISHGNGNDIECIAYVTPYKYYLLDNASEEFIPQIKELLKDNDEAVRKLAERVLKELGAEVPEEKK